MYSIVRILEKLAGSVIDTMYAFFIAQLNLIYPVRGSKHEQTQSNARAIKTQGRGQRERD